MSERVVLCRIRFFPTLISKKKLPRSGLPLILVNVTDVDGQANNVLQRFYEEFKLKLVSQLSVAAGVSFIRISRLYTIGLGANDEFFIQFNILDKYPHSKAQEQTDLKQAVENLQAKV